MANPLYNMMGNTNSQPNNLIARFNQFRQNFKGDPRQQIQELLNSGKVSQQQYDKAVQMAQQFQRMLSGR